MPSSLTVLKKTMLTLDGQEFAVYDSETDGSVVFLLHGFPNSTADWRFQIPALLENGYRVIAMDLLGLGASAKPADISLYTAAKDTERAQLVLETLGIETFHIVCHDRGTGPGWGLAVQQPDRVMSLSSLTVGHINAWVDASETIEWREKCWYWAFFQFDAAPKMMVADNFKMFRNWMRHHPSVDAWVENLRDEAGFTAGIAWYRANANPEAEGFPPMPNVSTPVLILYSPEDHYSTMEAIFESRKYLDGPLDIQRVDGASHFLMLDRPEKVNELLLRHLAAFDRR